ncbi:MAG: ACP S-malonyltransferase [Candidatus Omnitrophota bacterium]
MSICYIFPGQGSQCVGMGRDLYDNSPEAKKIFDEAEDILPGVGVKKLCFEGPIEELTLTANSQVCILVVSMAALKALEAARLQGDKLTRPVACAGLSLGELTALTAAGVMGFADAVRLVRRRGELMEEASSKNPGGMASILGISLEDLRNVCQETGAEIANLNCPGQIVISGSRESVARSMELAVKKGARKAILLNVSGPFHSRLMKGAAESFRAELDKTRFSNPAIPVITNVTADYEKTEAEIKENLVRQLYSPVRWEDCVRRMAVDGCGAFFEIGPGAVLKGLSRRINPDLKVYNIEKMKEVTACVNCH